LNLTRPSLMTRWEFCFDNFPLFLFSLTSKLTTVCFWSKSSLAFERIMALEFTTG
jgi:hypothetical protein